MGVSLTSVYHKLNGVEPSTSAARVRDSAEQAQTLCQAMPGAARAPLWAGYQVRVLDGNVLGVREHRLMETRTRCAAPLPGNSLVVFDPALDLILDLVPSEDAYTQERALWEEVLPKGQPSEWWLMDRNLAPQGFQGGLIQRGAHFLAREHEQLRFTPLEPMHQVGRWDSGGLGAPGAGRAAPRGAAAPAPGLGPAHARGRDDALPPDPSAAAGGRGA